MRVVRREFGPRPGKVEHCGDPPNSMVVRYHGLEVERIEQLTLLTLAPPIIEPLRRLGCGLIIGAAAVVFLNVPS
jgi:hypothetical protein